MKFFLYFQSETRVIYNKQQLMAKDAVRAVDAFLQQRVQALEAAVGLNNPDTKSQEEWNLTLQRLLGMDASLRTLTLVDVQERPLALVSRFSPSRLDLIPQSLQHACHPQSNSHAPSISEVCIDPRTSEPVVYIRVPVTNPLREIKGSLTAELNLKFMWDLVDQLRPGNTGYVYLVAQNGDLIAFGDTARVLKGENVSHLPPVAAFLNRSTPLNAPIPDNRGAYKGLTGEHVIGTSVPLTSAPWIIVVEMPTREAYQGLIRTGITSAVITGIIALLAAIFGTMLARRLVIPLADLRKTAADIANGDRTKQARISGPAEVAHLAGAFNTMAAQLVGSLQKTESQYHQIKTARDALEQSETRLRMALEGTTDGIWDWNPVTGDVYFSPRWQEIIGYEPDDFQSSMDDWGSMIHPEDLDQVVNTYSKVMLSLEPFAMEFRIKTRSDRWKWVLLRGKVVDASSDGQPTRVAGSLTDISKRKQAESEKAEYEARFLQAQKMESIGRLAGGVAHDFNNMLTIILGRAELAMMKMTPSHPHYKNFDEILKVGRRSAALTRQLLGFARKQTIEPKVLNFNRTIEDMLDLLRRLIGEGIELSWEPSAELWPVRMDPTQIDQILTNLLVNARDAITDVGKVTIETCNTTLDQKYCSMHRGFRPGEFVTLIVSDNGCGMEKQTLNNIFEPFFSTKELGQGTGLGLATVYGIIKQNNGFINAYSEPGKGSTFKVFIPRHSADDAVADQPNTPQHVQTGWETVLVVEDDAPLLEITTSMLRELGYHVLSVANPLSALELAEQLDTAVHLVILDVVMPDMNGLELKRMMAKLLPDSEFLFMSGYTANVIAHQGILEDGLHFINKPFSIQDLAAKVRSILDA
ncbi:PAS domain-containing protein [Desulfonatronovibrio hydrogenovorans]|uniref:PAS domain-containing protein n=1 Tax=Desulfonatronovibrio hydrogenovorans TaxID=53245 RepID=UPI00123713CE|nr:PAS domain-containing protein [Desulfonatronovibrio hydrogenovorans]